MGISRSELLEMLLEMNMDSLVDRENGSCDFESELFIDILELSAGQPEDAVTGEGDAYNYWWDYDQADMLRSGRQLLYVQAIDNINHTGALTDFDYYNLRRFLRPKVENLDFLRSDNPTLTS